MNVWVKSRTSEPKIYLTEIQKVSAFKQLKNIKKIVCSGFTDLSLFFPSLPFWMKKVLLLLGITDNVLEVTFVTGEQSQLPLRFCTVAYAAFTV